MAERIQYVYECVDCAPEAKVVVVFDDQTERTLASKEHCSTLGHRVLEYQRRNPIQEETNVVPEPTA